MSTYKAGRHFLQIPGPSNVPDRILHAIGHPTIDHRGPEFRKLSEEVLIGSRRIFKTSGPVVIFPTSGTGAWEASLLNTLNPGDKVLTPFMGVGSEVFQALEMGRFAIGTELKPSYFRQAKKNLESVGKVIPMEVGGLFDDQDEDDDEESWDDDEDDSEDDE